MEKSIQKKIDVWLSDDYDQKTRGEIARLQKEDPEALQDAFYRDLSFGTGGLRGIMGVGTNRMNRYTVGTATQGLANYLKKVWKDEPVSVVISYDSRLNSREFAHITAEVLSANRIRAFLFQVLRPTPVLSFAVRHLHCQAGIMITASHNPKEYNGYKVYWQDGGQLVPPHDENVIKEANKITSVRMVNWEACPELITEVDPSTDEAYLERVCALGINPAVASGADKMKIVYTPLHGTGITMVPEALRRFGFSKVSIVPEQAQPDGNFPTVKSPNPEEKTALEMALALARKQKADLVLATDPDADRVGIAVRDANGEMQLLNGNQTGTLLCYYLLSQYQAAGKLNEDCMVVKTIVTTDLIRRIALDYNVACEEVLTGFKYIAAKIREEEGKKTFLFGGEESYGYLVGDFVRDKDAVSACCLIAEMAAYYLDRGLRLTDVLDEIHRRYGYFRESLYSVTETGKEGVAKIRKTMENLRHNPPKTLGGKAVTIMNDYKAGRSFSFRQERNERIDLPFSDVLQFIMTDNSKVTVRPSGTEPKIKFYFSAVEVDNRKVGREEMEQKLEEHLEKMKKDILKR